jgi:glycosyltransferase involved in cell wall biosynthesis
VRTVCWRLSAWDPDVASVRYRAAIPALHLSELGVASRLSAAAYGVLEPTPPDTVIFVKTFGESDVEQAHRAADANVPVVLDVCDNVFAEGYRAHSPENLKRMAQTAAAVVTTGSALADVLRAELGADVRLHVVPDPVETPDDVRASTGLVLRERLRRALRERQSDIPRTLGTVLQRGVVPALGRRALRGDESELPQVLWFGNAGSSEPRFGLVNLVDIAAELRSAAREVPFRVLVVTGDEATYRRKIAPLGLPTGFAAWDRLTVFRHVRESAAVVLPNSRDEFSVCKSANRATLALAQGTPVVATRIPSLDPFDGCVLFDDFRSGLVTYLRDRSLTADHVSRAQAVIQRKFAPAVVAKRWQDVLTSVG